MGIARLVAVKEPFQRARAQWKKEKRAHVAINPLEELLPMQDILLDIRVDDVQAVFERVAQQWPGQPGLDPSDIVAGLNAREALGTTGLGKGVAIPHARLDRVERAVAALVRCQSGIDFQAPDAEPVRLLFVLLVPRHAAAEHLEILAQVAERFSDTRLRDDLAAAPDAAQFRRLFLDWRSPIPSPR